MNLRLTLDEFNDLPMQEQFDIVFKIGNCIESRTEGNMQAILYALDDFYVEFSFNPKRIEIITVIALDREEVLNKYYKN